MNRSSCPKRSPLELAPPKFRELVNEVQRLSQAPIEIPMFEVVATCLASVQHSTKWRIPDFPPLPVGAFFIVVGEPSIGKGFTSAIVGAGIREYDSRIQSGGSTRDADFQIAKADWKEEGDELQNERRVRRKKKRI